MTGQIHVETKEQNGPSDPDPGSVADYADEDGNVSNEGLFEAAGDWRDGEIDNELLFEVAAAWR